MRLEWRPTYDEPDPPMPFWIFMLAMASTTVIFCFWLALLIG